MASRTDWLRLKLGDIAAKITVGHVGPMVREYSTNGVPFLRSQNVKPFDLDLNDVAFVKEEFHHRLSKSELRPGDVVIVRTGNPGAAAVIPDSLPVANCADLVIVRPGPKLDSRFVMYCINAVAHHHVYAHTVGAVQQHFNVGSAKSLELNVPPLWEQRAISSLLGAIDDKIKLGRQMSGALEAVAEGLFKSWFLDFDPVVARVEGRDPLESRAEVTALFPSEFCESELGPIPAGWSASTVGEEFQLTMGQSPPGTSYNETGEGIPFYQGRADFGVRFPSRRVYCTAPTRLAQRGDTLVTVRAPVGDCNMALETSAIGRGVAAVRHKTGSRSYTYTAMKSRVDDFRIFEGEGTLFGAIGKDGFRSIRITAPPIRVVSAFESIVSPLDDRIEANEAESAILSSLRDLLLPALVSGRVRIAGAERALEHVF